MTISTFTIIKNEAEFVGYGTMSVLDSVDEMIFFDGDSTDGTLEILQHIKEKYDKDDKIRIFKHKDCKDLKDSYVTLFNECLSKCRSDYVWFLHPDMICVNPDRISELKAKLKKEQYLRCSVKMKSFAGDRKHVFDDGRDDRWATIYKRAFGLHYYGHYGAIEEDLYFRDITGTQHIFYKHLPFVPYEIYPSDIQLYHYCDTKPYKRRYERMVRVLQNVQPKARLQDLKDIASHHPRVTCQSGVFNGKKFNIVEHDETPSVFSKCSEFERLKKG